MHALPTDQQDLAAHTLAATRVTSYKFDAPTVACVAHTNPNEYIATLPAYCRTSFDGDAACSATARSAGREVQRATAAADTGVRGRNVQCATTTGLAVARPDGH
jgi:hypothetical protein